MYCCATFVATVMVQGNKIKRIVNTTKLIFMSRSETGGTNVDTDVTTTHFDTLPRVRSFIISVS